MGRLIKKSANTRGLPPGALVHVGEKKTTKVKISVMDYSSGKINEHEVKKVLRKSAKEDGIFAFDAKMFFNGRKKGTLKFP